MIDGPSGPVISSIEAVDASSVFLTMSALNGSTSSTTYDVAVLKNGTGNWTNTRLVSGPGNSIKVRLIDYKMIFDLMKLYYFGVSCDLAVAVIITDLPYLY